MDNILNNNDLEPQKKKSVKSKFILIETIIIVILILVGWSLFSNQSQKQQAIAANIQQLEILEQETTRCGDLVSQQSGDFDQYEYCRQLLQVFSN